MIYVYGCVLYAFVILICVDTYEYVICISIHVNVNEVHALAYKNTRKTIAIQAHAYITDTIIVAYV